MLRTLLISIVVVVLLVSPVAVGEATAWPMSCKVMQVLGYHELLWKFCQLELTRDFLPEYGNPIPGGGSW